MCDSHGSYTKQVFNLAFDDVGSTNVENDGDSDAPLCRNYSRTVLLGYLMGQQIPMDHSDSPTLHATKGEKVEFWRTPTSFFSLLDLVGRRPQVYPSVGLSVLVILSLSALFNVCLVFVVVLMHFYKIFSWDLESISALFSTCRLIFPHSNSLLMNAKFKTSSTAKKHITNFAQYICAFQKAISTYYV